MMQRTSGSTAVQTALLMAQVPESEPPGSAEVASLVKRCVAGDPSAFEQIVARSERRVLTLAWRLLGNKHDAQDAAQEVFLRAFKYIHRFDVRKPLEPWLSRLTVNVCRDLGRKRQRLTVGDSATELIASESPRPGMTTNPHSELELMQQKQILRAALARLPEKERIALVLRDIEGFATSEVATILGSSEGTVRSQVSTGRIRLKRIVEAMNRDRR